MPEIDRGFSNENFEPKSSATACVAFYNWSTSSHAFITPCQVTQSNIILLEKCKCERWQTCLFDYFLVTMESGVHSNTAITTWRKKALETRREDEQEVSLNTRDKTTIPSEIWPAESLGHKREEKLVKKANQRLTWLLTKLLRGVKNGSFTKQEC